MLERDGYIPGVPCWTDTSQPDPEAALPFYSGVFGWEFENTMPADSPGQYFVAPLRGWDGACGGGAAGRGARAGAGRREGASRGGGGGGGGGGGPRVKRPAGGSVLSEP